MLDLKKLEEKLDIALANETSESLTKWFEQKRTQDALHSLGSGKFDSLNPTSYKVKLETPKVTFDVIFTEISENQNSYTFAA
jgi:hypothetical protein